MGDDRFAIGKGQHRHLSDRCKNSSTTTWSAAICRTILSSMMDIEQPLCACSRFLADNHAFAQRQAVGLDDCREAVLPLDIFHCRCQDRRTPHSLRWECRIFSSGFWQRPYCPRFWAAFLLGPKAGIPASSNAIHHSQHQWIIRGDHCEDRCPLLFAKSTMPSASVAFISTHGVRPAR